MLKIVYPDKKPNIRNLKGKEEIFCLIRKKWLVLTPEEWVRQNFLLFLTLVLEYPITLIAVEKQIVLSDRKKRFDIVVYNSTLQPHLLIECKEMNVPLTAQVLQQVVVYHAALPAAALVITNGVQTHAFRKVDGRLEEVEAWGLL